MLVESVSVKNFKLLGDFSVGGLRRVTLLGGDNGCGKTTLLEAVHMCLDCEWDNANPLSVLRPLRSPSIMNDDAFARLHHGGNTKAPIKVKCIVNGTIYSVKAELARVFPAVGGAGKFADVGKIGGGTEIRPAKRMRVDYSMGRASYGPFILSLTDEGYNFETPKEKRATPPPCQVLVFVPNGGLGAENPEDDADCLSRLEERGGKNAVLEALQIVVPQAGDITVGSIRKTPFVFVQMRGVQAKRPSILFGAGAQKILSLALALNSHEHGLFLVDEVAVGWHHSHLRDLWRMIFRVCKERSHQIIATTHSNECITAFTQAAKAEASEDDCRYIRLDPPYKGDPPEKVNPMPYDYGVLKASRRTGMEVR